MKTVWDYSHLAKAYHKRPAYSPKAIDKILEIAGVVKGDLVCDIGAGIGHLAIPLAERGLEVTAVEPNDNMRKIGIARTKIYPLISWKEGTGEETGLPSHKFSLVTFGSSFNVTDRARALVETHRLLKPNGWFACIWNHRDVSDPMQAKLEEIIKKYIPSFDYGVRRENQADVIAQSGKFKNITAIAYLIKHRQSIDDVIEAWHSHATLARQAGKTFSTIIADMERYLRSLNVKQISIPYVTRGWVAQAYVF